MFHPVAENLIAERNNIGNYFLGVWKNWGPLIYEGCGLCLFAESDSILLFCYHGESLGYNIHPFQKWKLQCDILQTLTADFQAEVKRNFV